MPRVQFQNAVLGFLRRVFGFVGGINPTREVDLYPPIIVADVMRYAAQEMAFFCHAVQTFAAGGAGSTAFDFLTLDEFYAQSDVAQQMRERGWSRADVDIWVVGESMVAATAQIANFAEGHQGVTWGTLAGSGVTKLNRYYANSFGLLVTGGASHVGDDRTNDPGNINYPFLLPDDETSGFAAKVVSGAGGDVTVTAYTHVWVVAKGTLPPGA